MENYETEQIKIMIDVGDGKSPVPFTSSMLYHPKLTNPETQKVAFTEYPYFNSDIRYPVDRLFQLEYYERVKFFFNREFFVKLLSSVSGNYEKTQEKQASEKELQKKKIEKDIEDAKSKLEWRKEHLAKVKRGDPELIKKYGRDLTENIAYDEERISKYEKIISDLTLDSVKSPKKILHSDIIDFNILAMLELLFPTKYPGLSNLTTSFNQYIKRKTTPTLAANFVFNESDFSYIKSGGNTLTISKIVWLNDMVNHPLYRVLIDDVLNYIKWTKTVTDKLNGEIIKKKKVLMERLQLQEKDKNSMLITANDLNKLKDNIKIRQSASGQYMLDPAREELNDNIIEVYNQILFFQTALENGSIKILMDKPEPIELEIDPLHINIMTNTVELNMKTKKSLTLNNFSDLTDIIVDIYKRYTTFSSKITVTGQFASKINKLFSDFNNIKVLDSTYHYINSGTINLSNEPDDKPLLDYIKQNYSKYTTFCDKIKGFIKDARESSNDDLQSLIYNYSQNTESDDKFVDIITQIQTKYINLKKPEHFGSDKENKYLYTGVNMIDSNKESVPHFEIYVLFDTFEEELTDETVKKIDCLYKEEYLGVKLENYLDSHNPYIANNDRVTFSIKAAEAKLKQATEADNKTNVPPVRAGGRKNKHNTVKLLRLTSTELSSSPTTSSTARSKRRHKNKRSKPAYTRRNPRIIH
jgi:hypothetical protein